MNKKEIDNSQIIKKIHDKIPLNWEQVDNNLLLERYLRKCEKIKSILLKNNNSESRKILDFGCGNGQNSLILNEMGFDVTGIEIRKYEYWKNIDANFVVYDGKKIPCNSNEFDLVVLFGVLEHIGPPYPHSMNKFNQCQKERKECLIRLSEIMKKDGLIFIFDFPNKFSIIEIINEIFNLPSHHERADKVSLKTLKKLVVNAGFEIIESGRTGVLPAYFGLVSSTIKNFINKNHKTVNLIDSNIDMILGNLFGQSNFIAARKKS